MSSLAIFGGEPVRKRPFPAWPEISKSAEQALLAAFRSGIWGIGGTRVEKFQSEFARLHGAGFGIAVMNGTAALEVALKAGRIGQGDEVIIPAYTFVATATAVLNVNAIPVFVDIDSDTYCIDPARIREAITPQTRAIIPVHFAGHPANMDEIGDIAQSHDLLLIEDAAQAHFAEWNGRPVGSFGDLATFSFQSSKNVTSGEGGIVLTNSQELASRCWSYHNCGRKKGDEWYHHPFLGTNFRMTEFQAAILTAQLPQAQRLAQLREKNARHLLKKMNTLSEIAILQPDPRVTRHAYHLFVIKLQGKRFRKISLATVIRALSAEGIPVSRGYVPLYREGFLQEAKEFYMKTPDFLSREYHLVNCPETEKASEESIWLPQNVLLGSPADLEDIVIAFAKVVENLDKLADL